MSRKGRAIDHIWNFVKYKGDAAVYAKCSCGFRYSCGKSRDNEHPLPIEPDLNKLYPYCPLCGARKTKYNPEMVRIDKYMWE